MGTAGPIWDVRDAESPLNDGSSCCGGKRISPHYGGNDDGRTPTPANATHASGAVHSGSAST